MILVALLYFNWCMTQSITRKKYFCQDHKVFSKGLVCPSERDPTGDRCNRLFLRLGWKMEFYLKNLTLSITWERCNLENLLWLSLGFSNRVWHGPLNCLHSFLKRRRNKIQFQTIYLTCPPERRGIQSRRWSSHRGADIFVAAVPTPQKAPWPPEMEFIDPQITTKPTSEAFPFGGQTVRLFGELIAGMVQLNISFRCLSASLSLHSSKLSFALYLSRWFIREKADSLLNCIDRKGFHLVQVPSIVWLITS